MKKIIGICTIFFLIFFGFALYITKNKEQPDTSIGQKLKIVTTLYPLYDFTKIIGGEYVDVSLLLPPGVEAHVFEPKPVDIVRMNQADIFIYSGVVMEPWVTDVLQGVMNKNLFVLNTSDGIVLQSDALTIDPHYWLDFTNAIHMVSAISNALIAKDPTHKEIFSNNSRNYIEQLTMLDTEYQRALSTCKTNEIVYGGHYAFGYMTKRYGLQYRSALGVSPDAEPTAQDLSLLAEFITSQSLQYIFYEELSSPKIAEVLANETHTKLLLLNGAHNISKTQFEQNVSFITIMKKNLENLKIGLSCQ